MVMIVPLLAAAATAGLGYFGQRSANRTNQREAAKDRAFQASQAERQMGFQERMRSTAWQSAVADMEAAGINPAVAYSQGPAAAPGGASGGGSRAAAAENSVSSALQAMEARKTLQIMDAQRRKTEAEARAAGAQARVEEERSNVLVPSVSVRGRGGSGPPPMLHQLMDAELATARAGATNMSALSARNRELARIARPMGDLSEQMGTMLPILTGLVGAAGPAGNFIRSLRRGVGRRTNVRPSFIRGVSSKR